MAEPSTAEPPAVEAVSPGFHFPLQVLEQVEAKVTAAQWSIPVEENGTLQQCCEAFRVMVEADCLEDENCIRFLNKGFVISFERLLTVNAVSTWPESVIERIVALLPHFGYVLAKAVPVMAEKRLFHLAAEAFNPLNTLWQRVIKKEPTTLSAERLFAEVYEGRIMHAHAKHGALLDTINWFGGAGGFDALAARIQQDDLEFETLMSLVKIYPSLSTTATKETLLKYGVPAFERLQAVLGAMSNDDLKKVMGPITNPKEGLLQLLRDFQEVFVRVLDTETAAAKLVEEYILAVMLQLFKCDSFNATMYALLFLDELASSLGHVQWKGKPASWLGAKELCDWILENELVDLMLRNGLHQEQYVRRILRVLTILNEQKRLTNDLLGKIWQAQTGKHETIVKNLHDLLANLAWHLHGDQLQFLFELFKKSWGDQNQEDVLVLMQRLAEEDQKGTMAASVLSLLWDLAKDKDARPDLVEAALEAHCHILDRGYDKDKSVQEWCRTLAADIKKGNDTFLAIKQLRNILLTIVHIQTQYNTQRLQRIMVDLDKNHCRTEFMKRFHLYCSKAKGVIKKLPQERRTEEHLSTLTVDGRYPHLTTVKLCLEFLRFYLEKSGIFMSYDEAKQVWQDLVDNGQSECEREATYYWLQTCFGPDADLDMIDQHHLFKDKILPGLKPTEMSACALQLFWKAFLGANSYSKRLQLDPHGGGVIMLNPASILTGEEVLWQALQTHPDDDVALLAKHLIQELYQAETPRQTHPLLTQVFQSISEPFLKLERVKKEADKPQATMALERGLSLLRDYIQTTDEAYPYPRSIFPARFGYQGRSWDLYLTRPKNQNQPIKTITVLDTDTLSSLRLKAADAFSLAHNRVALHNANAVVVVFRPELDHLPLCEIPGLCDQLTVLVRQVATTPIRFTSLEPRVDSESRLASTHLATQVAHMEKLQQMAVSPVASPEVQRLARIILLALPTPTHAEFSPAFNSFTKDGAVGYLTPEMPRFYQLYRVLTLLQLLRPTAQRFQAEELQAFRVAALQSDIAAMLGQLLELTPEELACSEVHEYATLTRLLDVLLHTLAFLNMQAQASGLAHPKGLPPAQFMTQLVGLLKVTATGRLGSALSPEDRVSNDHLAALALHYLHQVMSKDPALVDVFIAAMTEDDLMRVVLLKSNSHSACTAFVRVVQELPDLKPEANQAIWTLVESLLKDVNQAQHPEAVYDLICSLAQVLPNEVIHPEELLQEQLAAIKTMEGLSLKELSEGVMQTHLAGRFKLARNALESCPLATKASLTAFVKPLLLRYLFAASAELLDVRKKGRTLTPAEAFDASLASALDTRVAVYDFLCTLCTGTPENFSTMITELGRLHLQPEDAVTEFDYLPIVGKRSHYVGLKNAGATCYLNSSLQQLFMQPDIRRFLLANMGVADDDKADSLLYQTQRTFWLLKDCQQQFFVPEDMWRTYKHWGEAVNVREQQDATEFLNCYVDTVDSQLKACNKPQILKAVLGGMFVDEKIVQKGCSHRYTRDESFNTVAIEVSLSRKLEDGLEKYVQGEVLDEYRCEKCNVLRPTLKRQSIKRLPQVLAISLKRFDFDFERMVPTKFNNFYEFPVDLDMGPYTAAGLAAKDLNSGKVPHCPYRLAGVIVHSGQANGGHYYSFIRERDACGQQSEKESWLRFEDTEITPVDLTPEMMYEEWFGGEYDATTYDKVSRRNIRRTRERWWNAYMLYYERVDAPPLRLSDAYDHVQDPMPIGLAMPKSDSEPEAFDQMTDEERLEAEAKFQVLQLQEDETFKAEVAKVNLEFHHKASLYSEEYFNFLASTCVYSSETVCTWLEESMQEADGTKSEVLVAKAQALALEIVQKSFTFMCLVGFRTDDIIRPDLDSWKLVFDRLLPVSYEAVEWVIDYVTNTEGMIKAHLFDNVDEDSRMVFSSVLGKCADEVLAHKAQDTVAQFDPILKLMAEALKQSTSNSPKQMDCAIQFLHRYASYGYNFRRQLLDHDFCLQLGQHLIQNIAWLNQLGSDVTPAVQTVVDLLMTCRIDDNSPTAPSQLPDINEAQPLVANEGAVNLLRGFPLELFTVLLDTDHALDRVDMLIPFACWHSEETSFSVACALLKSIDGKGWRRTHQTQGLFQTFVSLDDPLRKRRLELFHKNPKQDNSVVGIFKIMTHCKIKYKKKTYYLGRFLVWELQNDPVAQAWLMSPEVKPEWNWITGWLFRSLQAQLPSSVKSNLDTTPYIPLERTKSSAHLASELGQYAAVDEVPADPAESTLYGGHYGMDQLSEDDSEDDPMYNTVDKNDPLLSDISG
eukprot:m.262868 g.262868  ORF g.262868 m.262868 type:complete len:2290 (-) comp17611_c0_seq1:39-6908(-)